MLLPTTLAVLAYVLAMRREETARMPYVVLAGVCVGVAVGYKQVAVFDGLAIALMLWLTQERPARAVIGLAGGFAAVQLVIAAPFLVAGTADDYLYALVGSLGLYSRIGPEQDPVVRFAGYMPALLAAAWLVTRDQRGDRITPQVFPVLWLGFAIAGATSSTFPFPHYLLQAVPALALTIISRPLRFERDATARTTLAAGAVLIVTIVAAQFTFAFENRRQLDPVDYYRTFVSNRFGTMSDQDYDYYFDGRVLTARDIASTVRADGAGASLFAWGEVPWVYPQAGARNPTRYYTSFQGELVPGAREEIMSDLVAAPPIYVVVSDGAYAPFTELEALVDERYELLRAEHDWRLYRLSGTAGRLPATPSTDPRVSRQP
jgi:hypothetical protein